MKQRSFSLCTLLVFLAACNGSQKKNQDINPSGFQSEIVFTALDSASAENYDIYILGKDGKTETRLTDSPGADFAMHACNGKIYFLSDRDTSYGITFLYEMESDGSGVRRVTQFPVYSSYFNGRFGCTEFIVLGQLADTVRPQLHIINRNGEVQQTLGINGMRGSDAIFLPDGKSIAFSGRKDKKSIDEIWVMQEDETGLRQVSLYPSEDTTSRVFWHAAGTNWNPAENKISFLSKQKGNYSIFSIRPDGSGLTQITPDDTDELWHSWSSDGTWLVYEGNKLNEKNSDIYLMKQDGSPAIQLTDTKRLEMSPLILE